MAWAGVQTAVIDHPGTLKLVTGTLDADAEVGDVIDLFDYFKGEHLPRRFTSIVTQSTGTVAAIVIALQGSIDNTNWENITSVTAKDTYGHYQQDLGEPARPGPPTWRYVRHLCTTTGAGNVNSIESFMSA